jgi:AcrR family transcriptional regulator
MVAMTDDAARERLLDAAEGLFYARGIQAVGMDAVREGSGLPLKRLYALYPGKAALVEAVLIRRDVRWRGRLMARVMEEDDRRERVLAVFDWLEDWFGEPGFRGCAWINASGELGATLPVVAEQARLHKAAFRADLLGLVRDAGLDDGVADAVLLLSEGAMVTAGIFGTTAPAREARAVAASIIDARGDHPS